MKRKIIIALSGLLLFNTLLLSGCEKLTNSTKDPSVSNECNEVKDKTSSASGELIELDKTYRNTRFNFEVSYPSKWEIFEENDNGLGPDASPDQSIYLYFDKNKEYFISIFGQNSDIGIADPGWEGSEFVTDEGVKGILYSISVDGIIDKYVVINNYHGYHGMHVRITKELLDKYENVITGILKSVKIYPVTS